MKEDKNESRWDKLLNIHTMGRDDTRADQYRYPYEPTPYSVLERLANAEQFEVPKAADCMYFFNPFSVEILRKVMARILESYYAYPRRIQLFFYYPSDEYILYLMTVDELMFTDEIVCMNLFPGEDPREKIAIFELN